MSCWPRWWGWRCGCGGSMARPVRTTALRVRQDYAHIVEQAQGWPARQGQGQGRVWRLASRDPYFGSWYCRACWQFHRTYRGRCQACGAVRSITGERPRRRLDVHPQVFLAVLSSMVGLLALGWCMYGMFVSPSTPEPLIPPARSLRTERCTAPNEVPLFLASDGTPFGCQTVHEQVPRPGTIVHRDGSGTFVHGPATK